MRQLILDIRADAPPTLQNFLPGGNPETLATLQSWSPPGTPGEPLLYLWGEPGVGKSHLLQAWAQRQSAPYLRHGPLPDAAPLAWALDDVHQLNPEDQIRLFSLINATREHNGRLCVAGNLPPNQLGLRPDLATRLAQGLVFRLHPLSDSDKVQALRTRAEARGLTLPDDVVRHLLTHCRRDLPNLLGQVDALDDYSLSRKRPATLALLKELLAQPD